MIISKSIKRLGLFCLLTFIPIFSAQAETPDIQRYFGTLQGELSRIPEHQQQGIHVSVLEVNWAQLEPEESRVDQAYVQRLREKLKFMNKYKSMVCLDLGMQYPPAWILNLPNARYVNQYGTSYVDASPGKNYPNAIFNNAVRQAQMNHVDNVFKALGSEFFAIRLGWSQYGELCYPTPVYAEKNNCYWAYDAIAQGLSEGLADGLQPCPVPNWKMGENSQQNEKAQKFIEWYLDALVNFQQFQIQTVRRFFDGKLMILYPSWGLRPGVLQKAIAHDLNTDSMELPRGLDYERLLKANNDPQSIVYCTWLDGDNAYVKDEANLAVDWSPIHYLSYLAQRHPQSPKVWAENTGRADLKTMQQCFERMKKYQVEGLVWAFEPDLYDSKHRYAGIKDFVAEIKKISK